MSGTELIDLVGDHGAEQITLASDPATGLRAIVAVHSTVLGPALGGTRFWPYPDERAAVVDVLRLARGMTYKHAACGNDLGGGKAVIIGDPERLRSDALIVAYAELVEQLGGRYLTAEDVGTTQADMDLVRTVTPHVTGVSERLGGSGDPSPATAWGVHNAVRAVAERVWGSSDLRGRHVAISGVGKVGSDLARRLTADGAQLTVADVRADVVGDVAAELDAVVADPATIHALACDVFAPCALGAVLSGATIAELQCAAVCGSANNQLATDADAGRLAARGVLYAPDYVVNSGGVINIADETGPGGYDHDRAFARVATIHDTLLRIFALADEHGETPAAAADRFAEARLARGRAPRSEGAGSAR